MPTTTRQRTDLADALRRIWDNANAALEDLDSVDVNALLDDICETSADALADLLTATFAE